MTHSARPGDPCDQAGGAVSPARRDDPGRVLRSDRFCDPWRLGSRSPAVHSETLGGAVSAVVAGLAASLLLAGCSLFPNPTVRIGPSSPTSPPLRSQPGGTAILLTSAWGGVGPIGPPLTTTCQVGGNQVTIRGAFGPETAEVELAGLHPGSHYSFVQFQPAVSATVRVSETGPIPIATITDGPSSDFLKPSQGLEPENSSGTLSVARGGRSGSLLVTLPGGDSVSGRWTCGARRTAGRPNRPVLRPATSPPVVDECWSGVPFSNPVPPPATCSKGELNVAAWLPNSAVESAGPSATLTQVERDLCQDQALGQSQAYLETEYAAAVVYYGWPFTETPAQVLAAANCPRSG